MKKYTGHYGRFDVLDQKEYWDPQTREIVEKRISENEISNQLIFDGEESQLLFDVCAILLDESRPHVLQFIVYHFHNKFTSNIGEAQRKKGVPKQSVLIRSGLQALLAYCIQQYNKTFAELTEDEKKSVMKKLAEETILLEIGKISLPTKEFFKQLLSEAVAAYYSHPDLWSEIGYAGPAYPRGYVRSELGLTDPWEAKRDDK